MIAPRHEIFAVLRQFNPWWDGGHTQDLPKWRRAAFPQLMEWLTEPPTARAILVSGARQVGKTTLLLQAVEQLLNDEIQPEQILYVTFDHPMLKLVGLDGVLRIWQELQPPPKGLQFLLLDEIQHTADWPTWLKHQVDFEKRRRIAVTGSAIPLHTKDQESGVGRLHTIKLPTLSFFEYLQLKQIDSPELPEVPSLAKIFDWSQADRIRVGEKARPLVPHFHEYLVRGGFPKTAQVENIGTAQRLLREDIVDRVLQRDMTAQFGVRRVLELEKTFLYLCLHDGGIFDLPAVTSSLGVPKPTVNRFLDILEAANLIYRLWPYGYGKEVLRARSKVYLADAAIAGSILLKGKSLIEDTTRLGAAVETAFFKHVYTRYYQISIGFSYWRGKRDREVDIVAEVGGELIPFEVKYSGGAVKAAGLLGLRELCTQRSIPRAYVITREMDDFEMCTFARAAKSAPTPTTSILKIPAPLACYWLSQREQQEVADETIT